MLEQCVLNVFAEDGRLVDWWHEDTSSYIAFMLGIFVVIHLDAWIWRFSQAGYSLCIKCKCRVVQFMSSVQYAW
jgi:hypothetical protein